MFISANIEFRVIHELFDHTRREGVCTKDGSVRAGMMTSALMFLLILWGVLQVQLDGLDDLIGDDIWSCSWAESDSSSGSVVHSDVATFENVPE